MAYVIVLLIAVAVAFPAGWLVCRAWLNAKGVATGDSISRDKHHSMLQAQRTRYRSQVQKVVEVVRRHEAARDQLLVKLGEVGDRLATSQQQNAELRKGLGGAPDRAGDGQPPDNPELQAKIDRLRDERDKLRDRVQQLETEAQAAADAEAAARRAEQRAERGELREKLAAAEHQRNELETRLADREARVDELEQAVESWKRRVAPLTQQVQNYRETIRQLKQAAAARAPAPAPADDLPADSLQEIRGIGPALERRLNAQGIRRFAQIAALEPVELADLADKLAISPSLPARDKWIEQANALVESETAQPAPA